MKIRKKTDQDVKSNIQLIEEEVRKSNVKISSNLLAAFSEFENGKTGEQIKEESPAVYKEYLKVLNDIVQRQKAEAKNKKPISKNRFIVHQKASPEDVPSIQTRLYEIVFSLEEVNYEDVDEKFALADEFYKKFGSLYVGTEVEDKPNHFIQYKGVNILKKELYFQGENATGQKEFITIKVIEGKIKAQKGLDDPKKPIPLSADAETKLQEMCNYMTKAKIQIQEPAEQYSLEL